MKNAGMIAERELACLGLLVACMVGCAAEEPGPVPRTFGYTPYYIDEATELLVGQTPGLVSWHRDVLTTCPLGPAGDLGDGAGRFDGCEVKTVVTGAIVATGIKGIRTAKRLPGGRFLLQNPNLDVVVRNPSGEETVVASAALTPSVAPDGERIVFIQFPQGTTEPYLGAATKIVLMDLVTGEQRIVTEDPEAYAPHIIPGTSDVLFVSGRTGVASLWIAPAGQPEVQLTNVGLTRAGKGFMPVPLQQIVWIPGTRRAVYTAHYAEEKIWAIDVESGAGAPFGPGRFPNLEQGDEILSYYPGPQGDLAPKPTVIRYPERP